MAPRWLLRRQCRIAALDKALFHPMQWSCERPMDRLDAMRVFATVADAGGFAAAARRLHLSAPAVTRAIAGLEERIGTRLLTRTTRVVRLTDAGARYLADCRRILAEIDDAEASAAGDHSDPRGPLAVTASVNFGRMYVMPIVLDFLARHRLVTARTLFLDRIVNLVEESVDVAVRIAHLPDSSLTAIRVGSVSPVVCASPAFLAAHGTPETPDDLSALDAVAFSASVGPVGDWTFHDGARRWTVRPPAQLLVNNADAAIAAAVAGRGVTRLLSYQIQPAVAAGSLVVVLARYQPPPLPVHVVHAEGRQSAARVRAFVELCVERLRAEPSLR
jgi:DNA-binding transcriptional LysR family regulator